MPVGQMFKLARGRLNYRNLMQAWIRILAGRLERRKDFLTALADVSLSLFCLKYGKTTFAQ